MNNIDLEQLAIDYPDNEDLIQVYQDWGHSEYLQELFTALNRYEPDWNKEKEQRNLFWIFCWIRKMNWKI